jgi:hypothetical protein
MAAEAAAQTARDVTLDVAAAVPQRCALVGTGVAAGSFTGMNVGEARSAALSLDCNTPFSISVTSSAGGLVPQGLSQASLEMGRTEGFLTRLDYRIGLVLPVLDVPSGGSARTLTSGCASATTMQAGGSCALSSGTGLAVDGISSGQAGQLTVTLPEPAGRPVAGSYADTITITIAPGG